MSLENGNLIASALRYDPSSGEIVTIVSHEIKIYSDQRSAFDFVLPLSKEKCAFDTKLFLKLTFVGKECSSKRAQLTHSRVFELFPIHHNMISNKLMNRVQSKTTYLSFDKNLIFGDIEVSWCSFCSFFPVTLGKQSKIFEAELKLDWKYSCVEQLDNIFGSDNISLSSQSSFPSLPLTFSNIATANSGE